MAFSFADDLEEHMQLEDDVLFPRYERRPGETRASGWVHDPFPKRFRGAADRVVTFPNLGPKLEAEVRRAYPGRACFYFRRDPRTEAALVTRCEESRALMARDLASDDATPLWVRPTAYSRTSFDPSAANRERRVLDARGRPFMPCCAVRDLRELGLDVEPEIARRCVDDGP